MARRSNWLAGVFAGLLLSACGGDDGRTAPGTGAPLPAVVLAGLSGEAPVSTEALRGGALVINFWASWCAPCRAEMPSLERLSHRLAARGVRVIGVTVDRDLNLAREFVRAHRLTFPNYTEGGGRSLQSALGVTRLPETVLVTPAGTIAARITGGRDWDSAESIGLVERTFDLLGAAARPAGFGGKQP